MDNHDENKIVLIMRQTRLDDIVARFNTIGQAKFYIEHLGADFSDYQTEDQVYKLAISDIEKVLKKYGRLQVLERTFVTNYIFGKNDLIVVVGQDGLVANILKYLDQQPVVAINPDPKRWDGVLLPFRVSDVNKVIQDVFNAKRQHKEITFAKVELNNGQCMYGVNDLFIGPKSHTSARYVIQIGNKMEQQSSSGLIISTGLGSTGWLKSILTGASRIAAEKAQQPYNEQNEAFDWASEYLYYSVREPFPSQATGTELVFGKITRSNSMVITSMMASNGVIFSDGIEADFIEFNSGTKATISIAEKKGILVV